MSYYMGDFYPRGDPGILDFFQKVVSKVPHVAAIKGLLGKIMPGGSKAGGGISAIPGVLSTAKTAIIKHPVLSAAGAAGVGGMVMGAGGEAMLTHAGAACPKGFHPCKSKHGCKKGPCVRNRKMNVCNPRALRRAARRAHGFLRLSRHLVRYYTPKAHKGKAYIGRPRKKK